MYFLFIIIVVVVIHFKCRLIIPTMRELLRVVNTLYRLFVFSFNCSLGLYLFIVVIILMIIVIIINNNNNNNNNNCSNSLFII